MSFNFASATPYLYTVMIGTATTSSTYFKFKISDSSLGLGRDATVKVYINDISNSDYSESYLYTKSEGKIKTLSDNTLRFSCGNKFSYNIDRITVKMPDTMSLFIALNDY
jgi:hypothetical protein